MSSSDETSWPLPRTWSWTTAGDIAQVVGGGTPDTTDARNFGGMIPWITPADMSTHVGKAITGGSRSLTETGLSGSGAKWLPEGAVLFSSRAPIGYTAIALRAVTTNQGFKSFIPESCVSSDYLYHWLTSSKERAEKLASGTTFLELSGAKAALLPVPLAPFAEQSRIVEKLEELLSELDAGVAELKAAQRKLAQYRQSLLKAAVEGALTADWRTTRARSGKPQETGAELLQRILAERRARWEAVQLAKFSEQGKVPSKWWQSKYPEPIAPDLTRLPTLPASWSWATVDQLTPEDLANGRSVPSAESGAKVLRLTAVKNGSIDLHEYKLGAWSDKEAQPFAVADGDLLIVRGNGSLSLVGRLGLVRGVSEQIAYPDTLIRLRVIESVVLPGWIGRNWDTSLSRDHLEGRARTSAGIYKISQPDIISVTVPVPPIAEQIEVLSLLERFDEQLTAIDKVLERELRQAEAQRKNILKAAFSGKLVPQDPNDEPASVLLERIRAERSVEAAKATRKRARKAKENE
ncbi:restriction endonuclease subunit S [Dyella sp.]|uniref:restriction endonuclease subunit S n=1 Tax=Dyella sp. TaxID=1869338 RepID=UPI002B468760|nr:restriction endonuclease subunit S [Dyella sp.]HKT27317.1 restriction endonuclease subunit S [Dyella sp.]